MIFDRYGVVSIAIPKTGTTCVFDILHGLPPGSKGGHKQNSLEFHCEGPAPIQYYKHGHFTYRDWKNFLLGDKSHPDPAFQIPDAARQKYKKYKVFSFVRNPYDRMASIFYEHQVSYTSTIVSPNRALEREAFKKFCDWGTNSSGFRGSWKTQTEFLQREDGKFELDFIGKLENFENEWSQLHLRYGFPSYDPKYREAGRSRRRKIKHFDEIYDEETKDLIFEYFKEDFVNFYYER